MLVKVSVSFYRNRHLSLTLYSVSLGAALQLFPGLFVSRNLLHRAVKAVP